MVKRKLVTIRPSGVGAKVFKKFQHKGTSYALIGHGAISAKSKKILKDSKGNYVNFDGKKVRV